MKSEFLTKWTMIRSSCAVGKRGCAHVRVACNEAVNVITTALGGASRTRGSRFSCASDPWIRTNGSEQRSGSHLKKTRSVGKTASHQLQLSGYESIFEMGTLMSCHSG